MLFDPSSLYSRFDTVCERLEKAVAISGRKQGVQLIAVSKKHPAEAISSLATYWENKETKPHGFPLFGENYVQEALEKQESVATMKKERIHWHFIGHIQSRKAKEIVGKFAMIHTVDSIKLARQLQKAFLALPARYSLSPQQILLQVNIGREPQKGGVMPEDLEVLVKAVLEIPELSVQGLMCLPPYDARPEFSRPFFQEMRVLRDKLEATFKRSFPELSMGMSHDCEVAVQEGATMVRVGTDIFGHRES